MAGLPQDPRRGPDPAGYGAHWSVIRGSGSRGHHSLPSRRAVAAAVPRALANRADACSYRETIVENGGASPIPLAEASDRRVLYDGEPGLRRGEQCGRPRLACGRSAVPEPRHRTRRWNPGAAGQVVARPPSSGGSRSAADDERRGAVAVPAPVPVGTQGPGAGLDEREVARRRRGAASGFGPECLCARGALRLDDGGRARSPPGGVRGSRWLR